MKVVILIPTRESLPDPAAAFVRSTLEALRAGGHETFDPIVVEGGGIDHVRTELVCAGLKTAADVMWLVDDDVTLTHPEELVRMIGVDCDVLAAPYLNRHTKNFFTIPVGDIERRGEVRIVETATVTLGATLVRRHVFEQMHADDRFADLRYDAVRTPGGKACALFQPGVMSAKLLGDILSPARVYCGEDKMFCVRAHEAGFKLHASIDVETNHRGLVGCLADEITRGLRACA